MCKYRVGVMFNQLCGHKSCSKLAKNHMKFDEFRVNYNIKLLHFPP